MTPRLLLALAVLLWTVDHGPWTASAEPKPNVILIFVDDLGYGDVGFNGATGPKTPNLDRMASEGMIFTDFYSGCAVCSGSRTALMTGCHYQRLSMAPVLFPDSDEGLHPDEVTIADMLLAAGYRTACIGKWHLGHLHPCLPTDQGFESYYGIPYSNDMWIDPANTLAGDVVIREELSLEEVKAGHKKRNVVPLMRGDEVIEYPADQSTLTKRYTEEAVEFITSCAGSENRKSEIRNQKSPFFLYLPHTMVHVPLAVSEAFENRTGQLIWDAIEEVDWSVGEILRAVSAAGIDENTLVIFTSDNGAATGSSLPLRNRKASVYDGGIREPTAMRWPGRIPAGAKCAEIAATIDILPTLAGLCGGKLPERKIDGRDIWPLMSGERNARSPHYAYILTHGPGAVRSGEWKFYPWQEGTGGKRDSEIPAGREASPHPVQLYDLRADIAETNNLAGKYPELAAHLRELYEMQVAEIASNRRKAAPMPRPENAPSAERPPEPEGGRPRPEKAGKRGAP